MINPKWTCCPLGELFEIGAGKTMSAAARAGADRVPFLRTSNVLWDELDLSSLDEMSMSVQDFAEKSLRAGDLLVCEGGEIGRAAVWDGRIDAISFQNHLHRLRPLRADVEPQFYVYFFQSAFTQLGIFDGVGNKTTIPNLSSNRLAALEVPHPRVDEQRAIASSLAELRHAIRLQEKACATARELKDSAMRELFTRGLRGERQKETEIGLLPDSWRVGRVGEYAEVISKGSSPKWQGFNYTQDGVLFVRSQNVGHGCMEWGDRAYLPYQWNDKEKRSILKAGDVLVNLVGASIGRAAVGGPEIEGANCNQAVCFVRVKKTEILPSFLSGFLLTEQGQAQIHGSKKDIARANLSLEDVRQILVPEPSMDEQRQIVGMLDVLDRKIGSHKRKHQVLEELFKSLLHKLMTGEIRVSDLDLTVLECAVQEP